MEEEDEDDEESEDEGSDEEVSLIFHIFQRRVILSITFTFFFIYPDPFFRVTKFLIFFQAEDDLNEIDPTAIVGRRTRGVKVDYTSKEALEKAGLQGNEKDEDSDEDVEMKEA